MDEIKLLESLRNPSFVLELVKSKTNNDFSELFLKYDICVSEKETLVLREMVDNIRQNVIEENKLNDKELSKISGGKFSSLKMISKPFYYMGYAPGYILGKIPIVGETVYYSIKDAIKGFYESLHSY